MQTLRPYQTEALNKVLDAFRRGKKRVIICIPTGGGKTTVASHIIHGANSKGNSTMFLAHRTELINQASERLDEHGIDHGIIQAKNPRVNVLPNQVASVQTIIRRLNKLTDKKIIVVDECHRTLSKSYLKILENYSDSFVIGLSATPYRTDGRGLGDFYEEVIECTSMEELIQLGYLAPFRMFSTPTQMDFTGLRKRAGDFSEESLNKIFNKPLLIGDVYEQWYKHTKGKRTTVVYASSVAHSKALAEKFCSKGWKFRHIDGTTPADERADILIDLHQGKIDGVVNNNVLTEGWDCPKVDCVVLARATASLGLYLQMCGRGSRVTKNKKDCILIDHGGHWERFGTPEERRIITLDGKVRRSPKDEAKQLKQCMECWAIYDTVRCPECGHTPTVKERIINQIGGDLKEVGKRKDKRDPRLVYKTLIDIAKRDRKDDAWVNREYKKIFGKYPNFRGLSLEKKQYTRKKLRFDKGNGTISSMPYFEYQKSISRY